MTHDPFRACRFRLAPLVDLRELCNEQTKTASIFPNRLHPNMSGLFSSSSASSTTNATVGDISKDVALTTPPDDGISDISFSPQSEHLAVSSWDKKVRIYEINAQGGSEGKALYEHEQPVLSCCWSKVCARFSRIRLE